MAFLLLLNTSSATSTAADAPNISSQSHGVPPWPVRISDAARDLVERLLVRDPRSRLTPQQAMEHAFFKGVDWAQVYRCERTPPFKPVVKHAGDTSNFGDHTGGGEGDDSAKDYPEIDVRFDEF